VRCGYGGDKGKPKELLTWCKVTDDPVVVSKLRPVKAGNSGFPLQEKESSVRLRKLEGKTATTSGKAAAVTVASLDGHGDSKGHCGCEGVKFYCGLEELGYRRTIGSGHKRERLKTLGNDP